MSKICTSISFYSSMLIHFDVENDDDCVRHVVEVFSEAYSIGVMIGLKGEKNNIRIPYDILEYFAEKYRLNVDDLTKSFADGIMNGLKERNKDTAYERDRSTKS